MSLSPHATASLVQLRPAQHGWPAWPQSTQVLAEQAAPPAVHVVRLLPPAFGSLQQVWPTAPHAPQLPLEQVPPTFGQAVPDAVQMRSTQQPPLEHALPAQHGWPAPPHGAQRPLLQLSPVSQSWPMQHACPGPPHAWHVPPTQEPPSLHVRSAQQAPPSEPQLLNALLWLVQPESAARDKTRAATNTERMARPPKMKLLP
jgi:hypothetical protein